MEVFAVILAFIGIAAIDLPRLIKGKQWGVFAISLVLLIKGFILSLLLVTGVKIPNPNDAIAFLIKLLPSL